MLQGSNLWWVGLYIIKNFLLIHYLVGGGYVTVRGCAPFNTDFFPRAMQQGMAGTYWNVSRHKII